MQSVVRVVSRHRTDSTVPSANKTETGSELRGACPAVQNKTGTGSWLPGACPGFVPKRRTATDQPAPITAGTKPGLAPGFEVPVPLLFPHQITTAGAIRIEFIPRCQRSIVVVRLWLRNPSEPQAVEWALARSKQRRVAGVTRNKWTTSKR